MKKPLVSILVPVFNVEAYLKQCLDSIINQTYDNLQIVLIDDGSTDESWTIMQEYAEKDNRIEIYQQSNNGVAVTRNHLLEKVKGDYVLFVDSDDWIELDTINTIMTEQKRGNYDIVSFEMIGSKNDKHETYLQEQAIKEFLRHITFRGSLCNKIIRTKCIDEIRFDEKVSYGEDAFFCWQLLQSTKSVRITPYKLYHYRMNDASLSHSSFDDRKFSAYYVWEQICADTEHYWPQYIDIARARFSIEMTLLLRDAARNKFNNHDSKIKVLQKIVRENCHYIYKTGISSWKMSLFSWFLSRSGLTFSIASKLV